MVCNNSLNSIREDRGWAVPLPGVPLEPRGVGPLPPEPVRKMWKTLLEPWTFICPALSPRTKRQRITESENQRNQRSWEKTNKITEIRVPGRTKTSGPYPVCPRAKITESKNQRIREIRYLGENTLVESEKTGVGQSAQTSRGCRATPSRACEKM